MLKKSLLMVVMALFVCSFITVAAVSADETQKITGTVDSFNPVTNELTIKDDTGDVKKLMAGTNIEMKNLKKLKKGDAINMEADRKGIIKTLVTEEKDILGGESKGHLMPLFLWLNRKLI